MLTALALTAMSQDGCGFREVKGQGRIRGLWGCQEREVLLGAPVMSLGSWVGLHSVGWSGQAETPLPGSAGLPLRTRTPRAGRRALTFSEGQGPAGGGHAGGGQSCAFRAVPGPGTPSSWGSRHVPAETSSH